MNLDYLQSTITTIGVIQGVLVIVLLLSQKEHQNSNRFLSYYLIVLILGLLEPQIATWANSHNSPWIVEVLGGLNFLSGPLMYLFVKQLTHKNPIPTKDHLVHFIPFLAYNLMLTLVYVGAVDMGQSLGIIELILYELLFIQIFSYLLVTLKLVFGNGKGVDTYSSPKSTKWLKLFLLLTFGLYAVSFVSTNLVLIGIEYWNGFDFFIQAGLTLLVYLTNIWGMFHRGWLSANDQKERKLRHFPLKSEVSKKIEDELLQYMNSQKPYLNNEFNLEVAANHLNTNKYYLSKVINESLERNFSDFVNEYRVAQVKTKLHNSEFSKYTIFGIALECGFNSKGAFNNAFKKFTGKTPSQYLDSFK